MPMRPLRFPEPSDRKTWFSYEIRKIEEVGDGYIVYPLRPQVMYYFINKRYTVEPKVGDTIAELRADESPDTHYGMALNGKEIHYGDPYLV